MSFAKKSNLLNKQTRVILFKDKNTFPCKDGTNIVYKLRPALFNPGLE